MFGTLWRRFCVPAALLTFAGNALTLSLSRRE
jgi:hypothetical protein